MAKFIDIARGWLGMREPIQAPPDKQVKFLLKYDGLLIGILSVQDGVWKFQYSEEFKQSESLRPIVAFPDVAKVYENRDLWQFFASRIPSPEQPEVDEILKREKIAEGDAVSLLKRFGRRTISNPFQLIPA